MKMTRPWSGKKDNLPSVTKKEQHKQRKSKVKVLQDLQEQEWEKQVREYASKQI